MRSFILNLMFRVVVWDDLQLVCFANFSSSVLLWLTNPLETDRLSYFFAKFPLISLRLFIRLMFEIFAVVSNNVLRSRPGSHIQIKHLFKKSFGYFSNKIFAFIQLFSPGNVFTAHFIKCTMIVSLAVFLLLSPTFTAPYQYFLPGISPHISDLSTKS